MGEGGGGYAPIVDLFFTFPKLKLSLRIYILGVYFLQFIIHSTNLIIKIKS